MLRLKVPIKKLLPIAKIKFGDPAIILFSFIKKTLCKVFGGPRPLINLVAIFESINSLLN